MAACNKNVADNYQTQVKNEAQYLKELNRAVVHIQKQEEARMDAAGERGLM